MRIRSYGQAGCGIAAALDVVGDRWTLLIVRELISGRRRFGDLRAALPGLAPNLLSGRLKLLVESGLVRRESFREIPRRVEYSLTRKGRDLRPVLLALMRWGAEHGGPGGSAAIEPGRRLAMLPLLHDRLTADVPSILELRLAGPGFEEEWGITLGPEGLEVRPGPVSRPDGIVTMSCETLERILEGAETLSTAKARDDVRFWGDHSAAGRLEQILNAAARPFTFGFPAAPGQGQDSPAL